MATNTSSFIRKLQQEVAALARGLKVAKARAFVIWFAKVALDLTEEEALDATSIEGSNDKGIDLFYIDKEEGKVRIVQGKYSEKGEHHPKIAKELGLLQGALNWLMSPPALRQDGKFDLAAAAEEYVEAIREGYGVELWFVYAGLKCSNVEKHIAVYNHNPENIEAKRSCRHCNLALLETFYEESSGHSRRLDTEKISLVEGKHFKYGAEFGTALVGTVPGKELVRLYNKYQDRLFERNVRLFLGAKKGSVNAIIAETLQGPDKSNFWAYNNGLTLVCTSFHEEPDSVIVNDFCIVNGCQSTRTLVENASTVDDTVTALVRVLAVGESIVDDVIRFTNSQNPIRAWDLASQHKTQRRLKREFDQLGKPYNYITRRGDQPPGNLSRYRNGSRPRVIKLAEVGQLLASLVGLPVLAYRNKAFIFSSRHDDVFPHDIKVEEVLFAWVCGQEVKEAIGERRKSGCSEEEERILVKGGVFFVMAAVGYVARLRNGATYPKKLAEEQITSKAGKERLRRYARFALEAYLSGVKDVMENSGIELNTLLRSSETFARVKDRVERSYRNATLGGEEYMKNALPKLV